MALSLKRTDPGADGLLIDPKDKSFIVALNGAKRLVVTNPAFFFPADAGVRANIVAVAIP